VKIADEAVQHFMAEAEHCRRSDSLLGGLA
jgi:hypothetical protein